MTEVLFYHLERASLTDALPGLLEKSLERGWSAVVQVGSAADIQQLDGMLWTYRDESFLPHGAMPARDPAAASQPVWITDQPVTHADVPNGAHILFLVRGATVQASALQGFTRCVVMFDGNDEAAVQQARALWSDAKNADLAVTYWQQSQAGRWEKKA